MDIKDNESSKKLEQQMNMIRPLIWGAKLLKKFGKNGELIDKLVEEMPEEFAKAKKLMELPDKFNDYFTGLGWIAFESMNVDLMAEAVELAENGEILKAEILLADYYTEKNLLFLKTRLKSHKQFMKRTEMINFAFNDFIEGRYYAVTLNLLSLSDALVADLSNNGLYVETTDLTSWDSISGHIKGLSRLRDEVLTKKRAKTNVDEITLPYRHGILHGRELNFNNKILASKCWSLLFSIGDWARSLDNKPIVEEKVSWKELFQQINKTNIQKEAIEKWEKSSHDIFEDGNYPENTPGKTCFDYLKYLKEGNFGKLVSLSKSAFKEEYRDIKKEAGSIRKNLKGKEIISFEIVEIKQDAPAIADVVVNLKYKKNNSIREVNPTVRVIYVDESLNPLPANLVGGKWLVIYDSINSLENSELFYLE